jgi:DNA-binding response OmpR family regulator
VKKRILIVDDQEETRSILRDMLSVQGYDILEAEDGLKALKIINKEKVDLLIADRAMPNMGGLELLEKLREEKKSIPSIVISAFGEERLWAEAIGLGAEDYILKPFSAQDVIRAVKKNLKENK